MIERTLWRLNVIEFEMLLSLLDLM